MGSSSSLIYQTYRRIDVPSNTLCLLYYVGVLLVIAIVFPVLMLRPGLRHMKQITLEASGGAQVAVTSFIASNPRQMEQQDWTIEGALRRCEEARCGDDARGATASCRCEYWDWMELVDSTTHQLHLATSVRDVVEVRRPANKSRGETRALAPWVPLSSPPSRSEDVFYTVEPENLPIRWSQILSLGRDTQVRLGMAGSIWNSRSLPGVLASVEVCDLLRSGTSLSDVVRDKEDVVIPLEGSDGDTFTLVDLLRVLPSATSYLTKSPPPSNELYLSHWVAEHGVELQVTAEFLNTIAPLYSSSGGGGGGNEHGSTSSRPSVLEPFAPGPLQYMICVNAVTAPLEYHDGGGDPTGTPRYVGVFSMFTAPPDWSRKELPADVSAGLLDARLMRRVHGARIHFAAHVNIVVADFASVLQFVGGTMGLLSVPWALTELLIGLLEWIGQKREGKPPHWFARFLLRLPPPSANRRCADGEEVGNNLATPPGDKVKTA